MKLLSTFFLSVLLFLESGLTYAQDFTTTLALANDGNAKAQSLVGAMYLKGVGTSKDDEEALNWFQLAAEQEDLDAYIFLGKIFQERMGVAQDNVEAFKWFQLAAAQGEFFNQTSIAYIFANGEGVAIDYFLAYVWASIASARGAAAGTELRDIVIPLLTIEQFARGEYSAIQCYNSNYKNCE